MATDPMAIAGFSDGALAASMLSAEVSHELAKTLAFLRCLVEPGQPSDAEAHAAEVAHFAGKETARIERVLNLLRRFKLGPPALAEVALVEIFEEIAARLAEDSASRGVAIAVDVPVQIRLRVDVMWFKDALVQLVRHAVGNAPARSRVTIRAAEAMINAEHSVLIEIEDRGPALSGSKPAQLFDLWEVPSLDSAAFHRAAAYRLLRQLGGTVDYQRNDRANVFQVSLPTGSGESR